METKELWFGGVEYNEARVIEKIGDLVLEKGGRIKTYKNEHGVDIRARGYRDKMHRIQKEISRYESLLTKKEEYRERFLDTIAKKKEEIRDLERLEAAAPVIHSRFGGYHGICCQSINFVLDSTYFNFSFSYNAFMEDTYTKIKLTEEGEYTGRYYTELMTKENEPKEYFVDDLWTPCAKEETIEWVAAYILDRLSKVPASGRVIEKKRRRVPNTYNDSWHWETETIMDRAKRKIEF